MGFLKDTVSITNNGETVEQRQLLKEIIVQLQDERSLFIVYSKKNLTDTSQRQLHKFKSSETIMKNVKQWSAETPNLYTLKISSEALRSILVKTNTYNVLLDLSV